jgi:hypothetical protein
MRKSVDATELDEVYLPEEREGGGLPPLGTPPGEPKPSGPTAEG